MHQWPRSTQPQTSSRSRSQTKNLSPTTPVASQASASTARSLVDFFRDDIREHRLRKKPPTSIKMKSAAPTPAATQPKKFAVPRGDRAYVIRSRVCTYKATGMSDDLIFAALIEQISNHFEDPDTYLSSAGRRKLKALIRQTPTLGARSCINLLRHRRNKRKPKPPTPVAAMRERFKSCPDEITAAAAREFFSIRTSADERHCRL